MINLYVRTSIAMYSKDKQRQEIKDLPLLYHLIQTLRHLAKIYNLPGRAVKCTGSSYDSIDEIAEYDEMKYTHVWEIEIRGDFLTLDCHHHFLSAVERVFDSARYRLSSQGEMEPLYTGLDIFFD